MMQSTFWTNSGSNKLLRLLKVTGVIQVITPVTVTPMTNFCLCIFQDGINTISQHISLLTLASINNSIIYIYKFVWQKLLYRTISDDTSTLSTRKKKELTSKWITQSMKGNYGFGLKWLLMLLNFDPGSNYLQLFLIFKIWVFIKWLSPITWNIETKVVF